MSGTSIWILMILVMVLSMLIQSMLKSRFTKYSQVPLSLSGAEVASRMLQSHGIRDVNIVSIPGKLTDHYDPTTKTVNLSEEVYYGRSIAAAAVAAHECGHVVQHATGYAWLRMRSALVPVVSFSSNIVSWVLLAGVIFINIFPSLIWVGIGLFALTTLFSFITLPVEIPASRTMKPSLWPRTPFAGPLTPMSLPPSAPWPPSCITFPSPTAATSRHTPPAVGTPRTRDKRVLGRFCASRGIEVGQLCGTIRKAWGDSLPVRKGFWT